MADERWGKELEILSGDPEALPKRIKQLERERNEARADTAQALYALGQSEDLNAALQKSLRECYEFFTDNHENAGLELYGRVNGKNLRPPAQRLNELLDHIKATIQPHH